MFGNSTIGWFQSVQKQRYSDESRGHHELWKAVPSQVIALFHLHIDCTPRRCHRESGLVCIYSSGGNSSALEQKKAKLDGNLRVYGCVDR